MGQIAKSHHLAFVIDNLDKLVKKVVNHKTLPIILCRPIVDSVEKLQNHRKTIEESHSNFEAEFCNSEEKHAFLQVKHKKIFVFSLKSTYYSILNFRTNN